MPDLDTPSPSLTALFDAIDDLGHDAAGRTRRAALIEQVLAEHDAELDEFDRVELLEELWVQLRELGRDEEALEAVRRRNAAGWSGQPDGRCDEAEALLRLGRDDEARTLYEAVRTAEPDDWWLYNNAGLAHADAGHHEEAVSWLTDGLECAMSQGDLDGIIGQMRDARRVALGQLGRDRDELDARVDVFLETWDPAAARAALVDRTLASLPAPPPPPEPHEIDLRKAVDACLSDIEWTNDWVQDLIDHEVYPQLTGVLERGATVDDARGVLVRAFDHPRIAESAGIRARLLATLAETCWANDHIAAAITIAQEGLELYAGPDAEPRRMDEAMYGRYRFDSGDREGAVAIWERLRDGDPADNLVCDLAADAFLEHGDDAGALEWIDIGLERALARRPSAKATKRRK